VGATLADWQKKREEEARRKAEAQEEKRANTEKRWGQKKAEDAVRQRWAVEKAAEEMAQSRTADSLRWAGLASVAQAQQAQDKAAFDHRMGEHTGEQDKVDAWKGQQADAARWAGLAAMEKNKEKANSGGGKPLAIPVSNDEPKWWEKITNAAVDAWQSTKTIVSDAFIATGNGISAIYKAGRQQTTDFLNVTKNQALGFWNDTKTTFSDLGETIKKSSADSSKSLIATFGEIPNYVTTGLNNFFSYQYDYHGPVHPPTVTPASQLLMPLPGISPTSPKDYILKNYQITQYPPQWPSRNECVTTATIQDMNMMQDILSSKFGVPQLHHMDLPTFTNALDGQPLWALRPPANVPIIGGMLPPQSATAVLEGHSMWLRETYGYGYTVKLTSYNTVDDLIENLQNGYPTSLHISQSVDLHTDWRAIIGGAPHTVTLAGYDSNTDHWLILDPANSSSYTEWSTPELMDKWGRQFLFYPPRFAMTTLIPDSMDASP
ncbi:MAG: C39 family peptidase, partial [Anaerolineales bacterium]|nr:C39 family peptidase [Anaerolineales bacterium]